MNDLAKEKMIVAVDKPDLQSALQLIDQMTGELVWAKIGLQLFTAEGPQVVREFADRGLRIFLDLKFHDIPNTAKEAIRSAKSLGVAMTTIHLAGGPEMLAACSAEAGDMRVLGVSVLTSMDKAALGAIGVAATPPDQVLAIAAMGVASGIRGVVASPQEILALRKAHGKPSSLSPRGSDPPARPPAINAVSQPPRPPSGMGPTIS
ncbi:MAG: orotidine-5'-phosphate decarboxylase [Terrimicrobiaceae bacterium]